MIARREVDQRLRTKSFALFTLALVAGILAIGVIARLGGDDDPDELVVAVAEPAPAGFEPALASAAETFGREASIVAVPSGDEARRMVEDGSQDVAVAVIPGEDALVTSHDLDDTDAAIVQQAWATTQVHGALEQSGLSPDAITAALSPAPLTVVTVGDEDDELTGLAVLTGTLTAILLFISLQTFGQYVLVGVIEEKSSAVVEVLLARVRADRLLAGKVIGIGLVALLQFALMIVAGLVSLAISGATVPGEIWSTVPTTVFWFVAGYAFYSTLYGLAGSLVSRQEDAQGAAAPILTVMMCAYFAVFLFGYTPESTASTVLSLIPPITPFLMPMRMAAGAASVLEVVVAAVLLVAATVATTKLAGRIYEQVLLRRGTRIPWREALRSLRRA